MDSHLLTAMPRTGLPSDRKATQANNTTTMPKIVKKEPKNFLRFELVFMG